MLTFLGSDATGFKRPGILLRSRPTPASTRSDVNLFDARFSKTGRPFAASGDIGSGGRSWRPRAARDCSCARTSQNALLGQRDPLERHAQNSGLGATSNAVARSIFSATTSCRRLSVKSTIPSSLPSRIAWASLMSSSCRISLRDGRIHPHDLDQRNAGLAVGGRPVLGGRQQLLGDDRLEVERQVLPHRRVHVLRETGRGCG